MGKVIIYTDGASRGNGSVDSIGAYGGIIQRGEYKKEISKAFKGVTNNQMELRGVIESLKILTNTSEVEVFSDSKYVCDAFNKNWIQGWKKKSWKTAAKKPVANKELWEELIKLTNIHKVEFTWVKGHSTNEGNQRADELCNLAMDNYMELDSEENIIDRKELSKEQIQTTIDSKVVDIGKCINKANFVSFVKDILSQTEDEKLELIRLDMIQTIESLSKIEKEYAKLGIR